MDSTLKNRMMERFGLSEARAVQALSSANVQRALMLVGEDNGLLESAALDALKAREDALASQEAVLRKREADANNLFLEANAKRKEAESLVARAESIKSATNELNKQTQMMLDEMKTLETPSARDKLRLLNIFLNLNKVGQNGKPYSPGYLSSCASILSGVPLEQSGGKEYERKLQ